MASSWPPKKNTAFSWAFFMYNTSGGIISTPTGLAGRYCNTSGSGATSTPVNVDSTGGTCRVDLTAAQMNSDWVTIKITSTTSGAIPRIVTIYTAQETQDGWWNAAPDDIDIADTILARDIGSGTLAGTVNERTVRAALRVLRNLVTVSGGTMTIKKEDDSTDAWTAAVTTSASAEPIIGIDPTGP